MRFNIVRWFKKSKDQDINEIEEIMKKINADISVDVVSILSKYNEEEEKKLKELYQEIHNYIEENSNNKERKSLIKNKYILDSIVTNLGNYDITKKIFEIVKNWDTSSFLPKGIKVILKSQIGDDDIVKLEDLYKEYNILKKDRVKDSKNYYYINSIQAKNLLTETFGKLEKTETNLLYIKDLDERKKINKEIISHIEELLNKVDYDGNKLNTIRLCKIRNIDNEDLHNDRLLLEIFNSGLINSGDILNESNTTTIVNRLEDALTEFKNNNDGYDGFVVLEIPNKYFKDNILLPEHEIDLYKEDTDYLTIKKDYIDSYIAINEYNFTLCTKDELIEKKEKNKGKNKK